MTWSIRYKRTFLKELAKLPDDIRARVESIAFGEKIKRAPFLGRKVQKLVGYSSYYKIRFGEYRVGLQIDQETGIVEFQRVLHRKDIYRNFPRKQSGEWQSVLFQPAGEVGDG
jgi:mRNA interferase RelE/StbE